MIKIGIKYFKKIVASIFILVFGYFIAAVLLSMITTSPEELKCTDDKTIYISTNNVHLDIIIPKEILSEAFIQRLQLKESIKYVSFGWGDKRFYLETPTWNDLKLSTAIKAMFLKSETAMHLTTHQREYKDWIKIPICKLQLDLLINYIGQSFQKDDQGRFIEIKGSGYTSYDTFYKANGNYNCIQTCNHWVNKGLKAAKIKTSLWSPFDAGVLYHLKKN